ncbi:MAG: amidohydrolase family protein [Haliscomenobacter sp.]|nr:amidohydrolase family protein [Haliscomenobacter sp.]
MPALSMGFPMPVFRKAVNRLHPDKQGPHSPGSRRNGQANAANPTNEQAGIQPEIKARDVLSPQEKSLEDLRKLGFTAAHVVPQGRMLPGSGALFLLNGNTADEMLIKDNTSLFATFNGARGVYPSTVIGVMSKFRELYKQAEQAKMQEAMFAANPAGMAKPANNKSLQAFYPVLDKKQSVYFAVDDICSIHRAMTLQQELGFPIVMAGLKQGWYVVDMIKSKNIPVLLSVDLPKAKETPKAGEKKEGEATKPDPEKEQLEARATEEMKKLESQAAVFAGKGISFGFATYNGKPAELRDNLRRMIKNGLTEDQALSALTTTPAAMLGMSQALGTVEKGKMANLMVSDKPYFAEKSNVRMVFVQGNLFEYEAPKAAPAAAPGRPAGGPPAASVGGKWDYAIDAQGDEYTGVLTITDNGGAVSGSWSSSQIPGNNPMNNPVLKDNQLTFSSQINMQGQDLTLEFDLRIQGGSFTGKVSIPQVGTFDIKGSRQGGPNGLE